MTDEVRFEEAEDGGVNLVFPDELIDALGIDPENHEVDVEIARVVNDGRLETLIDIDFNIEMTEERRETIESYLGSVDANVSIEDSNE